MTDMRKHLSLIVEKVMEIKSGQNLLILTDNYARPKYIAQIVMELASALNATPVLAVMEPLAQCGDEPPKPIAEAMKGADVVFEVGEGLDIVHTNARKEASEHGVKFYFTFSEISEDFFRREITFDDLKVIAKRTDKVSEMLSRANVARLTTAQGTNLTMDIKGREGLPVHPLGEGVIHGVPDFAEAFVCPNEGTTEGMIVIDSSVQGWGYLLHEPLCFSVRKGQIEEILSQTQDGKKFRDLISTDENSNNCVAELGIGTSHTAPRNLRGVVFDYAVMGTVHIAVGRNNDCGGVTWSRVHNDCLMARPTLEIDGMRVIENGIFKI